MTVPHVHLGFIWNAMYFHGRGPALARFTMKTPLLIVVTVIVLGTGSALAVMNSSCKSSQHAWCAPISDIRHHAKIGHS
jgi:hypothetical protein